MSRFFDKNHTDPYLTEDSFSFSSDFSSEEVQLDSAPRFYCNTCFQYFSRRSAKQRHLLTFGHLRKFTASVFVTSSQFEYQQQSEEHNPLKRASEYSLDGDTPPITKQLRRYAKTEQRGDSRGVDEDEWSGKKANAKTTSQTLRPN